MPRITALAALLVLAQLALPMPALSSADAHTADAPATGGRMTGNIPPGFMDIITPERIASRISQLQSLGTRYTYSARLDDAAGYILGQFQSMCLTASLQTFQFNGFTMSNVVAVLPGRDASLPWCVVGAHYDSVNGTDSYYNPYAPAPGADDDASGVAAMLAAAEVLAHAPTNRTILFAAFAGEEQGRIGSIEFVRQLRDNGTQLAGAFCFDMIGYNRFYPKVDLVSNADSLWMSQLARNESYQLGLMTEMVVTGNNPQNWSDQVSFWEQGYPAMYFIEDENPTQDSAHFLANPYYHTGADTLDKLNLTLMTAVARLGAATIARLAGLALPDLRPVLQPRPATALVLEPAVFNVSLANSGEAVTAANISMFIDGTLWDNRTLAPDGKQYAYISWIPSAGIHQVSIVANAESRYLEWDRSDNTIQFTLEVTDRPDLFVSGLTTGTATPLPGQAIELIAWVGNSGGAPAVGRLVIASDSGAVLYDRQLSLPAGQTGVTVATTTAPSGPELLTATISDVRPWESNASNNAVNLTIVPHIFDAGALRLAVTPEAAFARQELRFGLSGAAPAGQCEYLFDFGDGTSAGWTASPSVSYVYPAAGNYNASLMVRDAMGAVAALGPVQVLILDQHPVPIIDTDMMEPHVGKAVRFSGARSYDPDGVINQYSWEFGDGAFALGPVVSHVFTSLKTYIVRLTVIDDGDFYNLTTTMVTMVDTPPVARISASSLVLFAGEDAGFNASGSTDPDGRIFSWEWDFGDTGNRSDISTNHTFTAPGRYKVTLTVRDDLGMPNVTRIEVIVFQKPVPWAAPDGSGAFGVTTAVLIVALLVLLLVTGILMLKRESSESGRRKDEEE